MQRCRPTSNWRGMRVEPGAHLHVGRSRLVSLDDDIFKQMSMSRAATWKAVERDGQSFRVYFFNDRGGIYALGYPQVTWFGHVINLAELVFFCSDALRTLLLGAQRLQPADVADASRWSCLLREVRSSFYRKLFIAYVAAAVTPVSTGAGGRQHVFRDAVPQRRRRIGGEDRHCCATPHRRLRRLQQRGAGSIERIDDEFMLLVRRAIDEDVNLRRCSSACRRQAAAVCVAPASRSNACGRLPCHRSRSAPDNGGVEELGTDQLDTS
ncbi:MAG: hypothetical protein U0Q11_19320 [Vicinamibacterales bacterium]